MVDSSYVVLGGRNLNDKYYPNKEKKTELVDIETLIKGKPGADAQKYICLLYTSDAADERSSVDLGGRRIIKKKNRKKKIEMTTQ